jgi:hypothetical protein
MGFENTKLMALSDSKAAIDGVSKLSVGKVRHVSLRGLYLEELARRKFVQVPKVPGSENWSDVLTKHVSPQVFSTLMKLISVETPDWDEKSIDKSEE